MARRLPRWLFIWLCGAAGSAHAAQPEVIIDPGGVPPQALQVINESVGVIARQAEDQDGGEADRLRRRARDATLAALATQGYFSAQVTLKTGTDPAGQTWDIAIVPGERSVIGSVDLKFTGRITRDEYAARVKALREKWLLTAGKPFVNADWSRAKSDLLTAVASKDFLLAHMTASHAEVDAASARVALSVTIDSGPLVKFGALQTTGLKRVPDSLITRYIRYKQGDDFDQDKLDTWQQDLQGTAFFRGAFVTVPTPDTMTPAIAPKSAAIAPAAPGAGAAPAANTNTTNANAASSSTAPAGTANIAAAGARAATPAVATAPAADSNGVVTLPVNVRVVEAPPKRLSTSIGVDSDVGVRGEAIYRQNVVFGQPLTLETGVGVDRLNQRAYADIYLPPDGRGNKDSIGVLADHSNIQGLDETRYAIGATRLTTWAAGGGSRVDYETRWGLLAAQDHVKIEGGDEYYIPSVTATTQWLRRDVDSKFNPREGNLIALGGGVGINLSSGKPFTRADLRAQKWWPVGKLDAVTVRGEVGKVWSDAATRVPDDFGFRTGGARSIRGYKYLSIGAEQADAVVGAATLAVGSVEYDHYFNDRYGIGFFVDGGDAAASFQDMRIALGYGVGARVRTPAGPLFLDVAYGQRDHSLQLNFSLGIAF